MWSILGHVVKPKFYAYGRVGEEHKSGTQRYVKEGNLGNGINSKIVHDFFSVKRIAAIVNTEI